MKDNVAFAEEGIICPAELIGKAKTIVELIMAVKEVGSIKSYNDQLGMKKAAFWVERIEEIIVRRAKNMEPLGLDSVTRRHGLRKRLCELLGVHVERSEEPVSDDVERTSFNQSRDENRPVGEKYEDLRRLIESSKLGTRSEIATFLKKFFRILEVDADISADATDDYLEAKLLDAVILAHPDHHQISEKSIAFEPEYNRITALLMSIRERVAKGKIR